MGLEITNLEKRYKKFSLEIDLSVNNGELFSLLGPSGCGKTTLLRLISGLLTPDNGEIFLTKKEITYIPPEKRNIGIVFQDYALFSHMNVFQNIAYGLKTRNWNKNDITGRVNTLLKTLHLEDFGRRKILELSGGEQQRVALARALAPKPSLLLLDEPLSALDAELRKTLRKEILRIQKELNLTTIYVTHDQEEALAISDRIALIKNGKIEQTGTPEELYKYPVTAFTAGFIGVSNRVPVKLLQKNGNTVKIEMLSSIYNINAADIDLKKSYSAFFRPEECTIKSNNDLAFGVLPGVLPGIVSGIEYHGIFYQIDIKFSDATVKVFSTVKYKIKEKVELKISEKNIILISD